MKQSRTFLMLLALIFAGFGSPLFARPLPPEGNAKIGAPIFCRRVFLFGLSLLLLVSLSSPVIAQAPIVYDAFTGFSWVSNPTPDGIWSYGYARGLGGTLNLYTGRSTRFSLSSWEDSSIGDDPNVIKNETGAEIVVGGDIVFPTSDFLHFHPGLGGEFSVIRWTAPTAGRFLLDSTFRSLRVAEEDTTTDVHILTLPSGSSIFSGLIDSNDDVLEFSTVIQVGAGQGVDFVVGFGPNGNYLDDSTGLRARLTFLGQPDCESNTTTLCLNNGRFRVTAEWRSLIASGVGEAVPLTADSGYFWFFDASNIEILVKALNGCGFNSRYWIFAAGLTDVEVTLHVTDTQTGAVRTYVNPRGTAFQPIQDTSAFATCP